MRELQSTYDISLKKFYFRRCLRIFPPYYAFLFVMTLLSLANIIPEDPKSLLSAATYTWSLNPHAIGYCLFHSWSLSIEEIFYLFWPALIVWAHRRNSISRMALGFIVAAPVTRVALYFIAPPLRGHEAFMVQGWMDTLMFGCLLALLKDHPRWRAWRTRYINAWTATAAVTGFLLVPLVQESLPRRLGTLFYLSASFTITAVCISGVLIFVVENPESLAGRLLNLRCVRHIGVISYSLYLWQQVFLWHDLNLLPVGYVYVFACAEASFWLIEKPALRLRNRMENRQLFRWTQDQDAESRSMRTQIPACVEASVADLS